MDEKSHPDDSALDDTEEPLTELAQLDLEASAGFWMRVRNKIERRVATAQVMSFTWNLPKLIFLEFLEIAFSIFPPAKDRKGEPK
ncbi:MAG: hypothetical protein JXA73_14800 [Acidobacteria bacterium]|nr:hypothetical protein [Acidobacteriota bacterium]